MPRHPALTCLPVNPSGISLQPFSDATSLLPDGDALRQRAADDGFLYFRNLLPVDLVERLRREILQVLSQHGLLDPGAPLQEARANRGAGQRMESFCGSGVSQEAYLGIQKLELFHALPHHPLLLDLFRALFESEVFVHPRHIGRVMIPGPAYRPTPAHQDFIHVQGARQTWTAWLPIGDCPLERGGLAVLRGSHRKGIISVAKAEGAGDLEAILCDSDLEWVGGEYAQGDIITFLSTTVHKAIPATDAEHVRLSCDFRYQPIADPIHEHSLFPHCKLASWDEIYSGWSHPEFQYYWRRNQPRLSPWDESIRWQKEKIC